MPDLIHKVIRIKAPTLLGARIHHAYNVVKIFCIITTFLAIIFFTQKESEIFHDIKPPAHFVHRGLQCLNTV